MNFYFENNCLVLTEKYLLDRGCCCMNNCKNCPYKSKFYLLRTDNDLQFHIHAQDSKMRNVNSKRLPFSIDIEDKSYTIISCELVT